MYEMICLDLDGTLLNSNKIIDVKTSGLLNRLASQGIYIVIATGRHFDFAKYLTSDLVDDRIIISNNGTGIFDVKNNETYSATYLNKKLLVKFTELAIKNDLEPIAYTNALKNGFDIYVKDISKSSEYVDTIVTGEERIRSFSNPRDLNDILALVIYGSVNELEKFESLINRNYGDYINCHIMKSLYDDFALLEIMDINASKWHAIDKLSRHLKIPRDNIISFGDEINDIEMIRHSGLGVAMKNSIDLVRPYADRISKFNNDDNGVYHELIDILGMEE